MTASPAQDATETPTLHEVARLPWAVRIGVIVVAASLLTGLLALQRAANEARTREMLLMSMYDQVSQIRAAQWQLAANGNVQGQRTELDGLVRDHVQIAEHLARRERNDPRLSALVRDARAHAEALNHLPAAASAAAIAPLDARLRALEGRIDPIFEQYVGDAQRMGRAYSWGVSGMLLLAGALVWLLVRRSVLARLQRMRLLTEQTVLAEREQYHRLLIQHSNDVIALLDADGQVRFASQSLQRMLGYPPERVIGRNIREMARADYIAKVDDFLADLLAHPDRPRLGHLPVQDVHGRWRDLEIIGTNRLSVPGISGIVVNASDGTARRAAEAELAALAYTDTLTGLPNRTLFQSRLEDAIARLSPHGPGIAVMFVDVDNFKLVNDSLGHMVGDQLLQTVAQRLRSGVDRQDVVARFGGDEFILLLEGLRTTNDAVAVGQRVLKQLLEPVTLAGRELIPAASIGVAWDADPSVSAGDMVRNADAALYQAKAAGKGRVQLHSGAPTGDEALARLQLDADLRRAVANNEFCLHYQPQVDLADGRLRGAEALVRWEHPERGLLMPGEFIAQAEANGTIEALGNWVLEQACRDLAMWQARWPHLEISINVSALQFRKTGFVDDLIEHVQSGGIRPGSLRLELTESLLLSAQGDDVAEKLAKLRKHGLQLVLDDFGTGYASLSYLHRYPFDGCKIDRGFVNGLGQDDEAESIVRAIMLLAGRMSLSVCAEGVETEAQRDQLRALGCNQAQGFLYSIPLPAEEFEREWLFPAAQSRRAFASA